MLRFLLRIFSLAICVFITTAASAQEDTTKPTSVDPGLLAIESAKIPKEYTIRTINITGINFLDTSIVQSISGLQVGDKIMMPGGDAFSKAITNLWRQKLFSNIQIFITRVQENNIDIEINVQERPKLSNFKFVGAKKTEADELGTKASLVKSTIITENTRRNAVEAIQKYYVAKGYKNVNIRVEEKPDPTLINSNILTFYINNRTLRASQKRKKHDNCNQKFSHTLDIIDTKLLTNKLTVLV